MTDAAQKVPILGSMRPADTDRKRVEELHINVVDVLGRQFKGLHAYRSSHSAHPFLAATRFRPIALAGLLLRAAQARFAAA
ncbi:hypothetical protein ACVWZ4_001714 [Bradyrhizobium sp. USDA 4472]